MSEYITQPDAETYLSAKPGSDPWLLLDATEQQKYLTEAYRQISTDSFYDIPADPSVEQLTKLGPAQAEHAFFLFNNSGDEQRQTNRNRGIKRFKSLSYEEEYFEGGELNAQKGITQYNTIVNNLLNQFIKADNWVGEREVE